MPRTSPRRFLLCALAALGVGASLAQATEFELQPAQEARFRKFLPHSFEKLKNHEPITVVELGDNVMDYYINSDDSGDPLNAYTGVFLQLLADQFYIVGGVRVEKPRKIHPEKLRDIKGPEILLRKLCAKDRMTMPDGAAAVSEALGNGKSGQADLMLLSFGIFDAKGHEDLKLYREALVQIIEFCKKYKIDLILMGPSLMVPPPEEKGMGLTPPYSAVMKEEADAHGVFCADMGDLTWLAHVDERWAPVGLEVGGQTKKRSLGPPDMEAAEIRVADSEEPNPDGKVHHFFSVLAEQYHRRLDLGTQGYDNSHPSPLLHRLLGRRIFMELLNGPRAVPWKISGASSTFSGASECEVTCKVENTTENPLRVFLLPVEVEGWQPRQAPDHLDLPPKTTLPISITYQATKAVDPPSDNLLRLPMLVIGHGMPRFEVLPVACSEKH